MEKGNELNKSNIKLFQRNFVDFIHRNVMVNINRNDNFWNYIHNRTGFVSFMLIKGNVINIIKNQIIDGKR